IDAFSKSILSGKMSMVQFNSVIAASPSLFQAMADSITGGSQQALRALVSDGKLTADQLLKVTSQMTKLGEQADNMPATVGDAFVKLGNNFANLSGTANEASGATQVLVSGIDLVSENLDTLGKTAMVAGAGFIAFRGATLLT